MTMGWISDRRVWIGFGMALSFLLLSLPVAALLLVRGVLPMAVAPVWLWLTYGAAVFIGGKIAAVGQGRRWYALIPAVILYILAWLLALSCKGEIHFAYLGIGVTIAVFAGALAAYASGGRKRKRKIAHSKRSSSPRPSRR